MAFYKVTMTVEAARHDSVIKKLKGAFDEDKQVYSVEKLKTAKSRADRLSEAEGLVDDARGIVEELKDEMEQWYDSIPENLKQGDKASEVEQAKDSLDELQSNLDGMDWGIDFPGMF